ncbi:anthranilate synthase component I [Thalassorhabdus alkalitolerans]|uniref:Anthranilate synthase component 1 n=1 Tax=Thalassorhabdus alkalitolerans TaxID=2282697 RepID=A0ABW0YNZ4_9BACI
MSETTNSQFLEYSHTYRTVPYVRRFFADALTPIQLYKQVEDEAVFLLESKDEASPWSRYSFIGLNPIYRIDGRQGDFTFKRMNKETVLASTDLTSLFADALQWINPAPSELEVPFSGGAVGVVPFDAAEDFEPVLKEQSRDEEREDIHFLFCETIIALDHNSKELSIIHHADTQSSTAGTAYKKAQEEVERVSSLFRNSSQEGLLSEPITANLTPDFSSVRSNYNKEQFEEDVKKIKEYIHAGDIFQAVLSQRFEREVTVTAFDIYRVLRMINPSPYLFYLHFENYEIVGSSPERLVQIHNEHVEIHPIAGTRKRGQTLEEDEALAKELLDDEKERAEHYMLVDLARNDVGRIAEYGSVETPVLLEIGRFSHVMHIISKVTGRLSKQKQPLEALMAAFPAGTVSGAPKIRAMEILKELEPDRRGVYAGAVTYVGYDGNVDSCIAIRTMVVKNGKAYIQAGAGVVADSVPEKEFEETQNKAGALIRAIETAETMFSREKNEESGNHDQSHAERLY